MNKKLSLLLLGCIFFSLQAQDKILQSGPMVAYSTMKEVLLWVQTTRQATVHIEYWSPDNPSQVFKTNEVTTQSNRAFVAHLMADQLEPGQTYNYRVYIDGVLVDRPYHLAFQSQKLWKWRGDAPDFSFGTGSCAYINDAPYDRPGEPYGGEYPIFEDIYKKAPDFFLWLGDNVYLREADWNSLTGIQYRFTHTRSTPEMQAMLGSMHHYFIWDDHDYGPDNSDRSFHMKKATLETFKNFYPGPDYIYDDGITSFFQWADCDFFLLDNRTWRTPNFRSDVKEHTILGQSQLDWLFDALVNSVAAFKFVVMGGQFLNPTKNEERYANFAPEERRYIMDKIVELRIEGVIFITGDVHYSEISKYDEGPGYPLYDLTVSPLTSGVAGQDAEENPLQVKGTLVKERAYAKIDVSGPATGRKLTIHLFSSDGEEKWSYVIEAKDLKFRDSKEYPSP